MTSGKNGALNKWIFTVWVFFILGGGVFCIALEEQEKHEKIQKIYYKFKKEFPQTPDITPHELLIWKKKNKVVLVDVREAKERKVSMIPGAISQKEFLKKHDYYKDNKMIVVSYCTIGYRSGLFSKKLRAAGFEAYNLKGSILGWTFIGGELVNDGGITKKVHTFNRKWNFVADGYSAVW